MFVLYNNTKSEFAIGRTQHVRPAGDSSKRYTAIERVENGYMQVVGIRFIIY